MRNVKVSKGSNSCLFTLLYLSFTMAVVYSQQAAVVDVDDGVSVAQ